METKDLILFIVVASVVGFKLYQKYGKKGLKGNANDSKSSSEMGRFSGSKDDDYEPYSKK